jgi:hypothetical protein
MTLNRLELIEKRLYEDSFYQTMFSAALDILKEILCYEKDLIVFGCIRGSLVTGSITPGEDIDILVNSKMSRKIRRYVDRIGEKHNSKLKKILPQLTRANVVSVYMPETPQDPYERYKFFIEDPVELEIRTTQAEQDLPYETMKKVHRFQRDYLKNVVNTILKNPLADSIEASENIRKTAMDKYGLDRDTAHNSTIITQGRLIGLIFSREEIQQNMIVKERDKIVEEFFADEFAEIKYLMKL